MPDSLPFSLEVLTKEEAEGLTAELQEVLKKYDAELGVKSTIELMKRVYPSPMTPEDVHNGEEPATD